MQERYLLQLFQEETGVNIFVRISCQKKDSQ
jgi:hypothetical protein